MRLYQPLVNRRDGTKCQVRVWWCQYYVEGRLHRASLKTRDKRVAEQKARDLMSRTERLAAGLIDPIQEEMGRPLSDHITDFMATLVQRGATEQHREDRRLCLARFVEATGATHLRDLESGRVSRWLADLKAAGMSARTINRHLQAVRQLARFCVQTRRLPFDPLLTLKPLNEAADRRHVRRALSQPELARLLDAAARRPLEDAMANRIHTGVTPAERVRLTALGRTRRLVYSVAAGTGLRRGELSRLRWTDLDLERRLLSVPAASAKSRKDQSVPLRSDLAADLAAYRPASAAPTDLVFPVMPNLRTLKFDLVAAGLARIEDGRFVTHDGSGRELDFHCLRVSAVSAWVAAGAHPRVAQALARHAKIETTMGAYTDLARLDLRGAVEATAATAATRMQKGTA